MSSNNLFHARYLFHYVVKDKIVYLCISENISSRSVPFLFLEDVIKKFRSSYGPEPSNVIPYGYNEFTRVLGDRMVMKHLILEIF